MVAGRVFVVHLLHQLIGGCLLFGPPAQQQLHVLHRKRVGNRALIIGGGCFMPGIAREPVQAGIADRFRNESALRL